MKANIHPTFFTDTQVVCSCGNMFTTGSTKKQIFVEVCSKCHPLYTGEKRFIDAKGAIGKFQERQKIAAQYKPAKKDKKKDQSREPKSLRELLGGV